MVSLKIIFTRMNENYLNFILISLIKFVIVRLILNEIIININQSLDKICQIVKKERKLRLKLLKNNNNHQNNKLPKQLKIKPK